MTLEIGGEAGPSIQLNNSLTETKNDHEDGLTSPPIKRFKQSHLPFSPLVQQQKVSSNTLPTTKRKQAPNNTNKGSENEQDEVSSTRTDIEIIEMENEEGHEMETEIKEIETCDSPIPQGINKSSSDDSLKDDSLREDVEEIILDEKDESAEEKAENLSNTEKNESRTSEKKRRRLSTKEREELKQKRAEEIEKKRIEKEEKRLEKERLKEEARLKKEEKQKELLAKKQEIEMKKEEKRKEIEMKRKKKEDEKQEMLARKNEEKQALEEKKKQDELEKSIHEEEIQKKTAKAQAKFVGFFYKKDTNTNATPRRTEFKSVFKSFEVKENQRLAPIFRFNLEERGKLMDTLSNCIKNQNETELYLSDLKTKKRIPQTSERTWPRTEVDDELQVIEEEQMNAKRKFPRAKLLKFHENVRPPYWGTWRKKSQLILPRNPFLKDTIFFDYEIDSDDEWEEEEPGESLSGTEDEVEKSDGEYEVDNDFFVPHGYLSDEEQQDEDNDILSADGQKIKLQLQEKEFLAERKDKLSLIKPKGIGPVWCDDAKPGFEEILKFFKQFEAVVLSPTLPIEIYKTGSPLINTSKGQIENNVEAIPSTSNASQGPSNTKTFPEEAMPFFIRLLHGNTYKKSILIKEFIGYWDHLIEDNLCRDVPLPLEKRKYKLSKSKVFKRFLEIAALERVTEIGKRVWIVKREILEKYSLTDLPLCNSWDYCTIEHQPCPPLIDDRPPVQESDKLKERTLNDNKNNVATEPTRKTMTLDRFIVRRKE